MRVPVGLPAFLVDAARDEAKASRRSLAGQIEHWPMIGRVVEKLLPPDDIAWLARPGSGEATPRAAVEKTLRRLEETTDRTEVLDHPRTLGGPRYGSDRKRPGPIVRIDPDGRQALGRLDCRVFVESGKRPPRPAG